MDSFYLLTQRRVQLWQRELAQAGVAFVRRRLRGTGRCADAIDWTADGRSFYLLGEDGGCDVDGSEIPPNTRYLAPNVATSSTSAAAAAVERGITYTAGQVVDDLSIFSDPGDDIIYSWFDGQDLWWLFSNDTGDIYEYDLNHNRLGSQRGVFAEVGVTGVDRRRGYFLVLPKFRRRGVRSNFGAV